MLLHYYSAVFLTLTDVRDILADAGFFRGFHVGGDGGNGGTGAEGNGCGFEQVLEHDLSAAPAAAKTGVNGEEGEHVHEAQHVVDDQGAAVVANQLRTVGGNQGSEETEKADGRIVGNDLDHIHDAAGHIGQQLGGHGFLATGHLDAEAAENGEDDQGQNCPAAPQFGEVRLGEEVDDHIRKAKGGTHFALGHLILALDQGEDPGDDVHDQRGDTGGDTEGNHSNTHDLAGLFHGVHVGNGGGDGAEYHGDHDTEHQIDEYGTQRFQNGGTGVNDHITRLDHGEDGTGDAAGNDTGEHHDDEAVVFQKLFHRKSPCKLLQN